MREPEALTAIRDMDVNTCFWWRSLDTLAERDLATFTSTTDPFESRLVVGSGDDLASRLGKMVAGRAPVALRWALEKDVVALVRLYARLVEPRDISVNLALLADDACRRFHSDEMGVRMVCTYAGPGTECAPDSAVDRRAIGKGYSSNELANAAIVPHARSIRCARNGEVVLLKGDAWPGNRGFVHRSPPIEALGLRRLVLVVNAIAEPS